MWTHRFGTRQCESETILPHLFTIYNLLDFGVHITLSMQGNPVLFDRKLIISYCRHNITTGGKPRGHVSDSGAKEDENVQALLCCSSG